MVDSGETSSNTGNDDLLERAIAEYLSAIESGSLPDRGRFLSRYSEIAEELGQFLEQRHRLDELVRPIRSLNERVLADANTVERIRYFGDFELIEEIARGGMGVVYKARQVSLDRLVALKMILGEAVASEQDRERFRSEAESAARLDHKHIVPIYEVGEHVGRQYFSMNLIPSGSLRDFVAADGPLNPDQAAQMLAQLARAVHYAHQRGILHRDLKPANILLEFNDNQINPMIADFGLAKNENRDDELTQSGMVLGSPYYMSPEQAEGKSKTLTTTTDIYGLGAILFYCLTGHSPFHEASGTEILDWVRTRTPSLPSRFGVKINRDLDTICLKCLNKAPVERYRSAEELAEDLERYLRGEAISARPVSTAERCVKWVKRNKVIATLIGVSSAAIIALIVGLAISNIFIRNEQERTSQALQQVNYEKGKTDRALNDLQIEQQSTKNALWEAYVTQAVSLNSGMDVGRRFDSLAAIRKAVDIQREPGFELSSEQLERIRTAVVAAYSTPLDLKLIKTLPIERTSESIYFSHDFHQFAVAHSNAPISVRTVDDGKEIYTIPNKARLPIGMQFVDQRKLFAVGRAGQYTVFDVSRNDSPIRRLERRCNAFASDVQGNLIAMVANNELSILDCSSFNEVANVKLDDEITALQFDSSGQKLAVADQGGHLRVLHSKTGRELTVLNSPSQGRCYQVALGHTMLAATYGQSVHLFNHLTGKLEWSTRLESTANQVAIFEKAGILVTSDWDQYVRFWHLDTGRQLLQVDGRIAGISKNHQIAIAGNSDVKIWQMVGSEIFWGNFSDRIVQTDRSAVFHPKHSIVASARKTGVQIWDANDGIQLAHLPIGFTDCVAFHPTSGDLLTTGQMGFGRWRIQKTGSDEITIGPPEYFKLPEKFIPESLSISDDGRRIGMDSRRYPWALTMPWKGSGKLNQLKGDTGLNSIAISPDGKFAATGNYRGQKFSVWNAESGEKLQEVAFGGNAWVKPAATSNQFIVRSERKTHLYDISTGSFVDTLGFLVEEYSNDRKLAGVFLDNRDVGIVDADNHELQFRLADHFELQACWDISFDKTGSKFLQVEPSKGMLVWNLLRIKELLEQENLGLDLLEPEPQTATEIRSAVVRYSISKDDYGSIEPIDISNHYNWKYADFANPKLESSKVRAMELLPNNQILQVGGITFQLGDGLMQLGVELNKKKDHAVKEIPVDRHLEQLHFLHNVRWGLSVSNGTEIGNYLVRYEDGETEIIPLRTGSNIIEWMEVNFFSNLSKARTAWLCPTKKGGWIGLSVFTWKNPHPKNKVSSIDFVSAQKNLVAPFCLAISSSQKVSDQDTNQEKESHAN